MKYTAGVQGFVPESSEVIGQAKTHVQANSWQATHERNVKLAQQQHKQQSQAKISANFKDDSVVNNDGSYQISYNTGDHSREEKSDTSGNVQGRYSYVDEAGEHDLTYISGPETGFVVTGGSLSKPNGLIGKSIKQQKVWSTPVPKADAWSPPKENFWSKSSVKASVASNSDINHESNSPDGSAYSFFYNADSHARQEESDASGNVRGSYAIRTDTGFDELAYEAGKDGFVVTGGSLAPRPPSWENPPPVPEESFNLQQDFGSEDSQFEHPGFFPNGRIRPLQIPNDHRAYSMEKSVQPTFTIIAPESQQKSFENGAKSGIVLGFLPPKHDAKHGYIYDTQK